MQLVLPYRKKFPGAKIFAAKCGLGVFIRRRQKEFEGGF
jgi:hypothetical protein